MAQKQVMSNVTLLGEIITMFLRSDGTGWAIPMAPVGNGGFAYSPLNTNSYTSTTLGSGTTWNGVAEEIVQSSGVVTTVNSSQAGRLTVNWYQDAAATIKDCPSQVFRVQAGQPLALALRAYGNYLKLSFTNNGGAVAAVHVDTYYGVLEAGAEGLAIVDQVVTVAVANTAVQLPSLAALRPVRVKANPANNVAGMVIGGPGTTTATGYPLMPGQELELPAGNLNLFWANSANAGDTLHIIGG